MVLHPAPGQAPPHQQAFAVAQPPVVVAPRAGCDCSIPPNASSSVKATRTTTIVIIVVHAIALAAFGFFLWSQWIAALMAIISGGVLLCQFNKCAYTTAAILYTIGCIFDLVAMGTWIAVADAVDDDDYYNDDDTDSTVGWLALAPAVAAVTLLVGAIFAFLAICKWDQSGAPDAMPKHPAPHAAQPTPAYPVHAHVQQPPAAHAAQKGPPPAYSGTV